MDYFWPQGAVPWNFQFCIQNLEKIRPFFIQFQKKLFWIFSRSQKRLAQPLQNKKTRNLSLIFWGPLPHSALWMVCIVQGTMVLIKIECIIKYYPFECTSIWTDIIKRLWKVKKLVMVRLKFQDILWFINEHSLKCKKTLNRQALVVNFLRPSTLLLWKFLIS